MSNDQQYPQLNPQTQLPHPKTTPSNNFPPIHIETKHEITEVLTKTRKIVGLEPISDADLSDHYTDTGDNTIDECNAIKGAFNEFLSQELKMSPEEINDLGINNITRNKRENNIKVYIHLNEEEMSSYIFKKAAIVQNRRVQIRSYIPPQLFQRYVDLSKNLYHGRQIEPTLKTQIRIGQPDLLL